jgi:hypothetical protein
MQSFEQPYSKAVERDDLESALGQVEALVRPPEDTYYQELKQSWRRVRLFLPALLKTVRFGYTPAGRALASALKLLAKQDGHVTLEQVHPETVTRAWRQYVFGQNGVVDRRAYTFCCLDRFRSALRRRDLFVAPSIRYADARIGLLSGSAWEAARTTICRSLGHSVSANETIAALSRELNETYRAVAANLPNNPAARVEALDGQDELVLTALDKLEEPASLVQLREAVSARLPRVDLPDILLEIAARTDFASKFTHISERASRVGDFAVSVCAVLIAEACNIGLEPLVRADVPVTEARSLVLGESELSSQ